MRTCCWLVSCPSCTIGCNRLVFGSSQLQVAWCFMSKTVGFGPFCCHVSPLKPRSLVIQIGAPCNGWRLTTWRQTTGVRYAVYNWYEDVHGDAERDIFNTDWCVQPYEDSDCAGDNVKVWAWTEEGWVDQNALIQKTTHLEFRHKRCGIASRIESIDFEEMSIISEKHVERQKVGGKSTEVEAKAWKRYAVIPSHLTTAATVVWTKTWDTSALKRFRTRSLAKTLQMSSLTEFSVSALTTTMTKNPKLCF